MTYLEMGQVSPSDVVVAGAEVLFPGRLNLGKIRSDIGLLLPAL